ncbi:HK97 family phage prohead protease [Streptomyces spinosirectus]|jgi:HK97 family phage prohead protease|uniref:HK97 family phage prohead protease n=1 Tax=Streptomyces TaxID=1883 RepID=UPI001C9D9D4B|nr:MULTISPECIES: HK97 family phage prohead protease [Streptomyces]MBY8342007.1 HK97 family phage prohead protease [Streptomyces plumbidurans]UIR16646.1 HK97 family phage prohead protease [Streptomyces spinosirectus]
MVDRRSLIDAPERRSIAATDFELRQAGDSLMLSGYASVFDHPYDVLGGAPRGWTEVVDRRAFDVTLANKPDVHLLINHEGMPLARTKSGTLRLGTDARGLLVTADLDRRDPDVQRLETKMARGDMDEMSFAFRVKNDAWSDDDSQRRLTEVSLHKGDVSVVNFGANPATSAELNMRSVLDYLTSVHPDDAAAELRALGQSAAGDMVRAGERLAELRRLMPGREARALSRAEAFAVVAGDLELSERADQGNITTPNAADLNAAARQYAASRGWAMPNGSYPIRPANMHGASDLEAALRAVGRGSGSHDAIRKHIATRARAIGLSDQIPSNWNPDGSISG